MTIEISRIINRDFSTLVSAKSVFDKKKKTAAFIPRCKYTISSSLKASLMKGFGIKRANSSARFHLDLLMQCILDHVYSIGFL